MNEGKVLCISNDERIIKSAMFDYLFETNQEFDVDFFELRNWGEYDIEIFKFSSPNVGVRCRLLCWSI